MSKIKTVNVFAAQMAQVASEARLRAKAFANYCQSKNLIVGELVEILTNVYRCDVLYTKDAQGNDVAINEEVFPKMYWYTPVTITALGVVNGQPVDIGTPVVVPAIEIARAMSNKLEDDEPDIAETRTSEADYKMEAKDFLLSISSEAANVVAGTLNSAEIALPRRASFSGITTGYVNKITVSTSNWPQFEASEVSFDPEDVPRYQFSIADTLESLYGTYRTNSLTAIAMNSLAVCEDLSYSELQSALTTHLGSAAAQVMNNNRDIVDMACNQSISVADRIRSLGAYLSDLILNDGDNNAQNDNIGDGVVTDLTAYSGTPATAYWTASGACSGMKSACMVIGKIMKNLWNLALTAVTALWTGLKKLWNKFIKPAYQSKDFQVSEGSGNVNYVDVPLVFAGSGESGVPYSAANMQRVIGALLTKQEEYYVQFNRPTLQISQSAGRASVSPVARVPGFNVTWKDGIYDDDGNLTSPALSQLNTRHPITFRTSVEFKRADGSIVSRSSIPDAKFLGDFQHIIKNSQGVTVGNIDAVLAPTAGEHYHSDFFVNCSKNVTFNNGGGKITATIAYAEGGVKLTQTSREEIYFHDFLFTGSYNSSDGSTVIRGYNNSPSDGQKEWTVTIQGKKITSAKWSYLDGVTYTCEVENGVLTASSKTRIAGARRISTYGCYNRLDITFNDGCTMLLEIGTKYAGSINGTLKEGFDVAAHCYARAGSRSEYVYVNPETKLSAVATVDYTIDEYVLPIFTTRLLEDDYITFSGDSILVGPSGATDKYELSKHIFNDYTQPRFIYDGVEYPCGINIKSEYYEGDTDGLTAHDYECAGILEFTYADTNYPLGQTWTGRVTRDTLGFTLEDGVWTKSEREVWTDGTTRAEWISDSSGHLMSRPAGEMDANAVAELMRVVNDPIDDGCVATQQLCYGVVQIGNRADSGGYRFHMALTPCNASSLFNDDGTWRITYASSQWKYDEQIVTQDEVYALILSGLTNVSVDEERYKDEVGDVNACNDLIKASHLMDLYCWCLLNPFKTSLVDYFGSSTQNKLFHTNQTAVTKEASNADIIERCSLVQRSGDVLTQNVSTELVESVLFGFIYAIISNKYAYMRVHYALFGDFPEFIPYLIGDRLGSPKYHISTDKEIQEYAENVLGAIVLAVAIVVATVFIGVAAVKIAKAVKTVIIKKQAALQAYRLEAAQKMGTIENATKELNIAKGFLREKNMSPEDKQAAKDLLKEAKAALKAKNTDLSKAAGKVLKAERSEKRWLALAGALGIPTTAAANLATSTSKYEGICLLPDGNTNADRMLLGDPDAAQDDFGEYDSEFAYLINRIG